MTTYATATEFKDRVNKAKSDDDALIAVILGAASRNIDNFCHRPEGFVAVSTAEARLFRGSGKNYIYLPEFTSVTKVEVKNSADDTTYNVWATTDYIPFAGDKEWPDFQPVTKGRPYDGIMVASGQQWSVFTDGGLNFMCRITAKWGFADTVPPDIKEATIMQAARWYKRYEGSMADALASGELGSLVYLKGLDPFIQNILIDGRYWRPSQEA